MYCFTNPKNPSSGPKLFGLVRFHCTKESIQLRLTVQPRGRREMGGRGGGAGKGGGGVEQEMERKEGDGREERRGRERA
jgi:hypothetical protein